MPEPLTSEDSKSLFGYVAKNFDEKNNQLVDEETEEDEDELEFHRADLKDTLFGEAAYQVALENIIGAVDAIESGRHDEVKALFKNAIRALIDSYKLNGGGGDYDIFYPDD